MPPRPTQVLVPRAELRRRPDSYANNYQINFPSPISSNQGDIRLDRTISSRQSVFARFSYKNRQVLTAPSAACTFTYCAEAGSPLQGAYNTPEIDEGLAFAHNFVFSPRLLNEFRGGFNAQHTSETQSYSTAALLAQTGFTVPQPDTEWSEAPQVLINGFMSTGAGNPGMQRGQIVQAIDNVTWTRGKHTFKFGVDFKRLTDHDDNVYGNYRSGWYVFDGSSDVGQSIGDPYTAFLLGYPDYTEVSSTNNPTMDGLGYSWAFFGQDDWKVTPNLTLNVGLRYELHPPLRETNSNTATFMPNWTGIGTDGAASRSTAPSSFPTRRRCRSSPPPSLAAIAPTPILTAAQAGIPSSLRYTVHTDLGPRLGFAWRPLGQREHGHPRRLGTFSRNAARFFARRRLGRPLQLPGLLRPGLRGGRRHAVTLVRRSFQYAGRRRQRHRGLRLRLPHPLQDALGPAMEPDLRAESGPQPRGAHLLYRQPRQQPGSDGRSQPGSRQLSGLCAGRLQPPLPLVEHHSECGQRGGEQLQQRHG